MKKHPYDGVLISSIKKQKKQLVEDFQHFKRDPVNRKRIPQSCFSLSVNKFRKDIKDIDMYILHMTKCIEIYKSTGVLLLWTESNGYEVRK